MSIDIILIVTHKIHKLYNYKISMDMNPFLWCDCIMFAEFVTIYYIYRVNYMSLFINLDVFGFGWFTYLLWLLEYVLTYISSYCVWFMKYTCYYFESAYDAYK